MQGFLENNHHKRDRKRLKETCMNEHVSFFAICVDAAIVGVAGGLAVLAKRLFDKLVQITS